VSVSDKSSTATSFDFSPEGQPFQITFLATPSNLLQ
jgi:hypothetical protein